MRAEPAETGDVDGSGEAAAAGGGAGGDSAAIFSTRPVALERLGVSGGLQRIAGVAASSGCVLAAFHGGGLVRWYPIEDEVNPIDFGRDRCNDISRVFLDRNGFHALITSNSGDSWYLNYNSNQARALPKLKSHIIEAVSWDAESTPTSTRDLVLGTMEGQLLHVVIEGKDTAQKERTVRPLFVFELAGGGGTQPVSGVHRERTVRTVDGSERIIIFVSAGCGVYAFVGPSIETTFQRYQGDNAAQRALVFEVPRDSPHGDLQIDSACTGPRSTKVLFWLTGVGVLAATIKCPLESEQTVLESPPDLIPFPPPKSMATTRQGGSLIASLLPPPPPPAPLAMALVPYHIVFLFEDRWAVVSRITHEVVQQQDWARSTYGGLRCLVRESESDKLWMCSEKNMFELVADREDRNAWSMLLQLEQFDDALKLCKKHQQGRVIAAHADSLYRQGRFLDSARKYAEATSVPFEHVALRFSGGDRKAALLEYLRSRLQLVQSRAAVDDKVTRALLGVWAVEVSLAYLNDLRQQGDPRLDTEKGKLRELLKDCKDLDVHPTIYHLLQSHGWLQELAYFATERRDYTTVILHHVSRCDYASAIEKLGDFQGISASEELLSRFAPVLFGAEPGALSSLIRRPDLVSLSPLSVLPGVYAPQASDIHRKEGIRYLEQALRDHPELLGQGEAEAEAAGQGSGLRREGGNMLGLDGGDLDDASLLSRHGWASGGAVLNALVVLHACDAKSASQRTNADHGAEPRDLQAASDDEFLLERFLESQESSPLLDSLFALRVCGERGLARAAVLLYGVMGLHEEAVDVALRRGDVALAKHNACKPADKRLRQRLWLKIVENQAAGGDVQTITKLIRESRELTVRDVLPYMSEMITIDAFKAEICECLDTYEGQILTLRQEMDDHRRALQAFKEDLKQAEERSVVIPGDQVCEICGLPAVRERFYVFVCKHTFHEACLRALVAASPTLSVEKRARVFALEELRLEHQAVAAGAVPGNLSPTAALAEIEDELDGILADDCPLCGRLMVQTIRRPFIDAGETAEVESWAIE